MLWILKGFKIIGIFCTEESMEDTEETEEESMGFSLHHHTQVSGLSVFYCLLSGLAPSALSVLCPPTPRVSAETHSPPSIPFW